MSTPPIITRYLTTIDGGGRVRIPLSPTKSVAAPWRALRLARKEGVVISREGLTEVRGDRPTANIPWDDIGHVTTSRRRLLPGSGTVTYTVVPRARGWVDRDGAPAAHRPRLHHRPAEYRMRAGYRLGPDAMAALLESARRHYSTHPG